MSPFLLAGCKKGNTTSIDTDISVKAPLIQTIDPALPDLAGRPLCISSTRTGLLLVFYEAPIDLA